MTKKQIAKQILYRTYVNVDIAQQLALVAVTMIGMTLGILFIMVDPGKPAFILIGSAPILTVIWGNYILMKQSYEFIKQDEARLKKKFWNTIGN